ncbi:MAG: PTS sugar transporter subunit IIA [Spirochaetes bacterium]|nr:PTS sugar transporter subunit IIA [Spirochaetota bacterium]
MAIVELISPEVVKVPLAAGTKEDVLRELVLLLKDAGKITDTDGALDALRKREEMGSTGLESGIAVPHAKTDGVDRLTMAIGVSREGIDYDSLDGKPSRLFFLMLAPPNQTGPHLEALAEIAKLARSKEFCDVLMNASSSEEIVRLFRVD